MELDKLVMMYRRPEHPVEALFVNRWSRRAMSGEPIDDALLRSLLEAARWAPSAFNDQPWHFLYARRDSAHWSDFLSLLNDANRLWAHRAAVLFVVLSRTTFSYNGKPSATHSFDTGAAWQNLALQGTLLGLVVHAMAGFDHEAARKTLCVPENFRVEAMVAVGRPGQKAELPPSLQEREQPSTRKTIKVFSTEGPFGGD